jgi:hypothetical protein
MRKKLEKNAISQLKSRIAQQNRATGANKQAPEPVNHHDNDSDIDPNDLKADTDEINTRGGGGNVTNAGQVQLTPA